MNTADIEERIIFNVEEGIRKVNDKFDNLFYVDSTGAAFPYVCVSCDKFITSSKVEIVREDVLIANAYNLSSAAISDCYDTNSEVDDCCWRSMKEGYKCNNPNNLVLHDMLLSPRAICIRHRDRRRRSGYSCCRECLYALKNGQMPPYAIANGYFFGVPPQCLMELTDVELAMITPVRTFGYCFSWTGGKLLKGSLSYFKVNLKSILRAVAHLDILGLHESIVVLYYGKMTKKQKIQVQKRNEINPGKVIAAISWLLKNNQEWINSGAKLEDYVNKLKNPVIIDSTSEFEEEVNNVEETEVFSVFFPDGTISRYTGGHSSIDDFREMMKEAKKQNYNIEFQCDLERKVCADYADNNLVKAFPQQFPYGLGGLNAKRMRYDGSFTSRIPIENYVGHLSMISQQHFQTELFSLVLYNMYMRQQMVRKAGCRVRGGTYAKSLSSKLKPEDVEYAMQCRKKKIRDLENGPAKHLLEAIDTVASAVPHSNEFTNSARSSAYAIQYKFGIPSFFLTVTPDDDNSFIIQVLSNALIDDDSEVSTLSDEELRNRAKLRTNLRIKYPGICALFFQEMMDIVVEEIIGWDLATNQPREHGGFFGKPVAYTQSVEEQGRRTLHSHFLIWVKEFDSLRSSLQALNDNHENLLHVPQTKGRSRDKIRSTEQELCNYVDKVSSSELFSKDILPNPRSVAMAFPHECVVTDGGKQRAPEEVSLQRLRNLRHKIGYKKGRDHIVTCPDCKSEAWSSKEFVESYLIHGVKVPGLTHFPEPECRRIKTLAIEYQKQHNCLSEPQRETKIAINASYNFHMHTNNSCFGKHKDSKPKKNRKRKREEILSNERQPMECRYRFPKKPRKTTTMENISEAPQKWFKWYGKCSMRYLKVIYPKRHSYDVYQNTFCPAVTFSKLACNSNISSIFPGPISQYSFKYNMKDTQEEDTATCDLVNRRIQKLLSLQEESRMDTNNTVEGNNNNTMKDDISSERSESIKIILSASFAHQSTNVVGGAMASYLTRYGSRFRFSHEAKWCPLQDLYKVLKGEKVSTTIQTSQRGHFFENIALHYICRPTELEDLSPYNFFSRYETIRRTAKTDTSDLLTPHNHIFTHPSYDAETETFQQGMRLMTVEKLVKFHNFLFPDTSLFSGCNILESTTRPTEDMENYAKNVCLMFCSYRSHDDIVIENSYLKKLRCHFASSKLDAEVCTILQNIQDTSHNSLRMKNSLDDLEGSTTSYKADEFCLDDGPEEDEEDDLMEADNSNLDKLVDILCKDSETVDNMILPKTDFITSVSFSTIKEKGAKGCGFKYIGGYNIAHDSNDLSLICVQHGGSSNQSENKRENESIINIRRILEPDKGKLVRVLLQKRERIKRSFKEITNVETIAVLQANGSVASIKDWGVNANLDARQRRAFEILTASFVLTFHKSANDPTQDNWFGRGQRSKTRASDLKMENDGLRKLIEYEKKNTEQLICLIHGPGGCGKTTVINLVIEYAREYCQMLEYDFSSQTIVVTAMTGVAATLINGETIHRAVGLGKKKYPEPEECEDWEATRLIIIDEISFADRKDIMNLNGRLGQLMKDPEAKYGGLNIVFSGDFRQLEPVGRGAKPLYKRNCVQFEKWINCFIELEGMHRFRKDPEYGLLLRRFRDGTSTMADIDTLSSRVVNNKSEIPKNMKYGCYANKERDSINTGVFERIVTEMYKEKGHTKTAAMIFSDDLSILSSNGDYRSFECGKYFWENCGEDDVMCSNRQDGKFDPVLKLYAGCPVMLTKNIAVRFGKANGSTATVKRIVLLHGVTPRMILLNNAIPVLAVKAGQVDYVELYHSNSQVKERLFKLRPSKFSFTAKFPANQQMMELRNKKEFVRMKGRQLPCIVNIATTGHKLQGSSVDLIFVHKWHYGTNWVYVLLSRITEMKGLYCAEALKRNLNCYAVPRELTTMLDKLRKKSPRYYKGK